MQTAHTTLLAALLDTCRYEPPVERVELVETHISWILLAGDFAYKIKKPVNFGFLDFSTLAKRRHFCAEEIRLNRRFAPQLYLEVISLGGTPENPCWGAKPAFEYAVKMRRFPQAGELGLMLEQKRLKREQIEQFAEVIARFHQQATRADPHKDFGSLAAISAPTLENFTQLRPLHKESRLKAQLIALEDWSSSTLAALRTLVEQRRTQGYIRECHGDLHLANMAWLEGQPLLFDCIEFNESLRWIDVFSDIAFLLMDLDDRQAGVLGWHFLNRYLQQTGDYPGLPLLNFYKVYRALVRAKVICLRLAQSDLSVRERKGDRLLLQTYLDIATGYCRVRPAPLIITHGFSGSGKTTFSQQLAPLCGAIGLHSDIERKRLAGLTPTAPSSSGVASGLYTAQMNHQTYGHLCSMAEVIARSGFPVIIDATFLDREQRDQIQQLAQRLRRALIILDFPVETAELYRRVARRSKQSQQASEATIEVLRRQLQQAEPLSAAEKQSLITVLPESRAAAIATLIGARE